MNASIAVTLIGPDRPGLIDRVATTAAAHGANWLESRLANLAGQFAGIVHLEAASGSVDELRAALVALEGDGLAITVAVAGKVGEPGAAPDDASPAEPGRRLALAITGHDRPGIVRDLSHALAVRGVSIESLETRREDASWSGETLFRAEATLFVPAEVAVDELERAVEALSDEIMVDASFDEVEAAPARSPG